MIGPTLNENDAHGGNMDALAATRLCAEAMGIHTEGVAPHGSGCSVWAYNKWPDPTDSGGVYQWCPVYDDAQAMALVKRYEFVIEREGRGADKPFGVTLFCDDIPGQRGRIAAVVRNSANLNRAIVFAVATMQKAKSAAIREGNDMAAIAKESDK